METNIFTSYISKEITTSDIILAAISKRKEAVDDLIGLLEGFARTRNVLEVLLDKNTGAKGEDFAIETMCMSIDIVKRDLYEAINSVCSALGAIVNIGFNDLINEIKWEG